MSKRWDTIWINSLAVPCEQGGEMIENAVIAIQNGEIAWIGSGQDLPGTPESLADKVYDAEGCCITPGFIDCHTHLIYAGNRANEFALRLHGMSYTEIAKAGGGIQATVMATRQASEDELFEQSFRRALTLLSGGVTTLEIKSGYGLNWEAELKILKVAQRLEDILPITIQKTFLGAHTLPPEFKNKADGYIDLVCDEMLPQIAAEKLADAVDVFCETIAFNLAQTERVFVAAKQYGLAIKCHAEQLSCSGVAELAARYQALSVDHLEYVSEAGIKAIAQSGTVAVLLPGAFYFLREAKAPPLGWLREYKVPIAIATDCNPGTSPTLSLLLMMNMACTLWCMTPEEVLLGVTKHAAEALGYGKTRGTLSVGKAADLAVWDVKHPNELAYYLGGNPLRQIVSAGLPLME